VNADPKISLNDDSPQVTESSLPSDAPHLAMLDGGSGSGHGPQLSPFRLWAHRLAVLLFVFFCATLGVILVVYPWSDDWVNNRLLFGHPAMQEFLAHGFVRGLCSGLGLLDIWIGFWEAVHYHE
jgi:hypothetical protein